MTDGVRRFLTKLGLSQHFEMFSAKGFDCEDDIHWLCEEDLNSMYIVDPATRTKILEAAKLFQPSKEYILYEWLRSKGLDHYVISFVESGIVDLADVAQLRLPDEDLYDELEITLPGHKRRLERAVHDLKKRQAVKLPHITTLCAKAPTSIEQEVPMAFGRWGKPRCLLDAKYDFLLLEATVMSTCDPRNKVNIEFMVDSGSDVVTLRQIVLDTMDLELIGPINSKGVHASRVKNLYKAYLLLGSEKIEIEVMGETYDSIGSRVIRHFRHFISGNSHIWLKGDYLDPTMKPSSERGLEGAEVLPAEDVTYATNQSSVETDSNLKSDQNTALPEHCSAGVENANVQSNTLNAELDSSSVIQSDSVKRPAVDLSKEAVNIETIASVEKIDFNFVLNKKDHNDIGNKVETQNTDETDKLMTTNGDIVDVGPIIEANRKRLASSDRGFDPCSENGKPYKKLRLSPRKHDGKTHSQHGRLKGETVKMNLGTVMNCRAVYYRSQVEDEDGS